MKSILFAIYFLGSQLAFAQQNVTSTQDFIIVNKTIELISDSPEFALFDITGKYLKIKSHVAGRTIFIDFSELTTGVYFVKTKERIYRYYVL